ncbi:hypothetical protein HY798_00790 [Candidatus Falkowbacteria bacterium]|nr:hypothetical protein [Candidatus Falkowbacteria bacterium]
MDILSKKSTSSIDPRAAATPYSSGAGVKLSVLPSFSPPPKTETKGARWFLAAPILLMILVFGGWLGLSYYKKYLEKEISGLDAKIAELQSDENKESAQKIRRLQQSLKAAQPFLKEHIFPAGVFRLIEESTLPEVYYDKLDLQTDGARVSLSGVAAGYNILAKQIAILNGNPMIRSVEVGKVNLGERGGVAFEMIIVLDPSIFKK